MKSGEVAGNSVQGAGAFEVSAFLFLVLQLLPIRPDFIHVLHLGVAEDVRVAMNQFVGDALCNRVEIEGTAFIAELAVENDLKEQITEFFFEFMVIVRLNGVDHLIDFLDGVKADGCVILFLIPWAAVRSTKTAHDFQEILDGGTRSFEWLWHGQRITRSSR